MRLAFCIFKYFPYGGLQRDMFRAVEIAIARGHTVDIYTMLWQGDTPRGATVNIVPVRGWTNHGRALSFCLKLRKIFNETAYDRVVGFNKIPGVDIYFTGENCFAQHLKSKEMPFVRHFPRYFIFSRLEKKVFDKTSQTEILLISPREKETYQKFYHTQNERFRLLFPGIEKPSFSSQESFDVRNRIRGFYNISKEKTWLLFVASDYGLKGLSRILEAIRAFDKAFAEKVVLTVVGQDKSEVYQEYLDKHQIKTRVDFLGASNNVYELMRGADLLVHPAKVELAGKVLLEAIVNYLPVLTTEVCGCAYYVEESGGGEVLPEPFSQAMFTKTLEKMLQPDVLMQYRENLLRYKINVGVYQSHQYLVECIENLNTHAERDFFLDADLIQHLPLEKAACMKTVFALTGKVYRQVKSRKTIATTMSGKNYFIKMHHGVGWGEILKNIFAFKAPTLGAKQEYQAILKMTQAGILVPELCAYATEGNHPAKINSFIVTKQIEYHDDLEKLCQTWPASPPSFFFKRRLIGRVAEIARNIHAGGMNHRDFYLCHLLLNTRSEDDFDLYLIDLHRVQIRKKVPLRWKIKDLSGLYFSAMDIGLTRKDIYYFLMHYYQLPLKSILKKHRFQLCWLNLRANMLYRRHQKKS